MVRRHFIRPAEDLRIKYPPVIGRKDCLNDHIILRPPALCQLADITCTGGLRRAKRHMTRIQIPEPSMCSPSSLLSRERGRGVPTLSVRVLHGVHIILYIGVKCCFWPEQRHQEGGGVCWSSLSGPSPGSGGAEALHWDNQSRKRSIQRWRFFLSWPILFCQSSDHIMEVIWKRDQGVCAGWANALHTCASRHNSWI